MGSQTDNDVDASIWNRPGVDDETLKEVLSDPESPMFEEYAAELLESTMDTDTVKQYLSLETLAKHYEDIKKKFSRSQSGNVSLNRQHWERTVDIIRDELGMDEEDGDGPNGTESSSLAKTIGRRLRNIREEKGMTQQEMAEKIGCSRQTISSFERGEREISLERINRYAQALDYQANVDFIESGSFREQVRVDIDTVLRDMGLDGDLRRLVHSCLMNLVEDIVSRRQTTNRLVIYSTLANIAHMMDIEASEADLEYFLGKNLAKELITQHSLAEEKLVEAAETLETMAERDR